jgi:hypothetical protein
VVHFRLRTRFQHSLKLLQGDVRSIPKPHPELRSLHRSPRHRQISVLEFPIGVDCLFERYVFWIFRVSHPVFTRCFAARRFLFLFYLLYSPLLSYMATAKHLLRAF